MATNKIATFRRGYIPPVRGDFVTSQFSKLLLRSFQSMGLGEGYTPSSYFGFFTRKTKEKVVGHNFFTAPPPLTYFMAGHYTFFFISN